MDVTIVVTASGLIVGAVLGTVVSLLTTAFVEWMKSPRLTLDVGEREDLVCASETGPDRHRVVLNLRVHNERPSRRFFWWLGRHPAVRCHGEIAFHDIRGRALFDGPMRVRFAPPRDSPGRELLGEATAAADRLPDHASYADVPIGEDVTFGVVARRDEDAECYAWNDENRRRVQEGIDPSWSIPEEQFLARVALRWREGSCERTYRIVHSSAKLAFRIGEI